ncbi:MAG: ATP-binding protein, partial [Syntrophobacteraceae bacterium]
ARNSHVLTADLFSSPVEVDSFCREAREFLAGNGLSSEIFPIELLLRESLNNAIFHGNCSDCRKKVQIVIMIGRKWIKIRVADEGPGFNFRKARRAIPDEESVCERGMAIFSIYADRISFNAKGNSICLWRRRLQEQDCE